MTNLSPIKKRLQKRLHTTSLLFITLLLFFSYPVSAERFNITNGAYTRSSMPDTNFGTVIQWTVYNPGYDVYIDLGSIEYTTATLYMYKTATNTGYLQIFSTSSFDENTITHNNQPSKGSLCLSETSVFDAGWHSFDVSTCGQYIILNGTQAGGGNWWSDDAVNYLNPYVEYEGGFYPGGESWIHFNPDTTLTNSTNLNINFSINSSDFNWYGELSEYVHVGVSYRYFVGNTSFRGTIYNELWGGAESSFLNPFYIDLTDYLNNAEYINSTFKLRAMLIHSTDSYVNPTDYCYADVCDSHVISTDTINFTMESTSNPINITEPTPIPTIPPFFNDTNITPFPTFPTPDISNKSQGNEGNVSVNTSWADGYYDFVDGHMSGFNRTILNVSSFVTTPLTDLTGYINTVNDTFNSGNYTQYNGFLNDTLVPVISSFPAELKALVTLYFIFVIILIIFNR